jgi:hypothetical protein
MDLGERPDEALLRQQLRCLLVLALGDAELAAMAAARGGRESACMASAPPG